MKRLLLLLSLLLLALAVAGCGNADRPDDDGTAYADAPDTEEASVDAPAAREYVYVGDKIAIAFPRELFFSGDFPEEDFLAFLRETGAVVAELAEDADTFWRNYPENAGTVDIAVHIPYSELTTIGADIESELQLQLESIAAAFDSVSDLETRTSRAYTRVVFVVDSDAFIDDPRVIELLDFVFPYLGQLEYLRRIFHQYDMTALEEIVFYLEDYDSQERIELYNFFLDAPLGLSMRHGVQSD